MHNLNETHSLGWAWVLEGVHLVRVDLTGPALAFRGLIVHAIEGDGTRILLIVCKFVLEIEWMIVLPPGGS